MSGRPSGNIPVWSSDLNYPAGAEDWSETPTKVDPGSTAIARGWEPGKSPAAQRFNFLMNRYSGNILAHDAIEVQNWLPSATVASSLVNADGAYQITYDANRGWLWAVGAISSVGKVYYSHNGINWTNVSAKLDVTPSAPIALSGIAFDGSGTGFACSAYAGSGGTIYRITGDAIAASEYTGTAVTDSQGHYGIVFEPFEGLFLLFGAKDDTPAVWTVESSGTVTARVLDDEESYDAIVKLAIAPTQNRWIALADASGTWRQWDAADPSDVWTDRGVVPFASIPRGLAYNPDEGLYMVTCNSGETYVSVDGFNWTLRSDLPGGGVFLPYCLACFGSLWVAVASVNSSAQGNQRSLVYSTDQGLTWVPVPYPVDLASSPGCLQRIGDRFGFLTAAGIFAASFRAR